MWSRRNLLQCGFGDIACHSHYEHCDSSILHILYFIIKLVYIDVRISIRDDYCNVRKVWSISWCSKYLSSHVTQTICGVRLSSSVWEVVDCTRQRALVTIPESPNEWNYQNNSYLNFWLKFTGRSSSHGALCNSKFPFLALTHSPSNDWQFFACPRFYV